MKSVPQSELDKLTQGDAHGAIYTASLQIVFYAAKPLPELAEGATTVYQMFLKKYGSSLVWYRARSMRSVRKMSPKYVDVFPTLCQAEGIALPNYQAASGSGLQDYLPPVFATGAYGASSWLHFHLPTTVAHDVEGLIDLVSTLAREFPYRSGHVGFSLCWNDWSVDRDIEAPRLIGPLLKRYPGLSLGTPEEICDQNLPPVNWLTLLGPELLKELDGLNGVQQAFAEDDAITVMKMGAGACIRAGESPQLGDVNRKLDLPLYRKVGKYLKELRGDQIVEITGLDEDESEAWLARFDS